MFNNSTGFQIHGGNYINVSGDVNLETHQHLTVQDRSLHDASSNFALESGSAEGYGSRELSGAARNLRQGMGVRHAPYAASSRPPLLLRGFSPPRDRASVPSGSVSSSSSGQARLYHASGFNQPATSTPLPSIDRSASSNSQFPHPLDYHLGNVPDPGSSSNPHHTIPSDWGRDRWSANFARGRQFPDDRADSFRHDIGYDSHQNRFQPESPQSRAGGTIINTQNVHQRYGETGIHILHRAVALEPLYDSAESFPQPRCHPETRTEILDDLYNWAVDEESAYSIRWLHGPAGAGKSAIMQTLCQRLKEAGRLGGAFFFKRGHATRGNAKVLFATLAYQLALHHRELNTSISRSAETDPSVIGRGMDVQLRRLIVEPCKSLRDAAPVVLLIDGLDECEGNNVQQEILRLTGSIAHDHSLRLRFLIASRPEAHIREQFKEDAFQGLYDSVNVEQSFDDIRTYLRDEFTRIHREHRHTMGNTPTPWPSTHVLNHLVKKSSGYFIYASTIIKFIDDKAFRPTKRLESIENLSSDDSGSPFGALDQLYFQILFSVPASSRSNLCDILCAIANFEFRSEDIDFLLGLEAGDVALILRSLHSVLSMRENTDITVHHASFLDFLHDHKRSTIFYIGIGSEHRTKLAHSVLNTLAYTYQNRQLNQQLNRDDFKDPLPWGLGHERGLGFITSVPPSPDLVTLIQLVNPDFLPWGFKQFDEEVTRLVVWLREIQPVPHHLIQRWEDYRFVNFYEVCAGDIRSKLSRQRVQYTPERTDAELLAPSLHVCRAFQARMNTSFPDVFEACRQLFSRSPQLIRIFQAIRLVSRYSRIILDSWFFADPLRIRFLLNLSPDEITTSFCSLRPIIGSSPRKLCALLMCLPILCQEFDELYPEALISTELACGSLRLIQRIGDGELPIWVWPHFSPYTGFESLEWGRHIRSSPELGPELLQDLRQFVPPWDVFVDEGRQRLLPIEFYDVVQWLKASSDPQLDLIERWQGYLAQSMGRSGVTYSGSDQLEKRWRRNMEREARSHGPPQPSDEEVIYCWEGVLENINRELGFEAEEFWAPAPDHIIPGTRVPATTALNLLNNLSVPKAAPKPGPFATAESPLFGARVGATPAGSIWAEPRDLMFPGEASQLQDTLKLEDQQQHLKEEKTGTFVIYSPDHEMPDPDDASLNPEDLIGDHGIEGCSVSVHEPVAAIAWIENNWEHPLLNSFQDKSCGGPLALMLSPQKPALALFGPYNDPSIATSAQSLAKLSGFPVVIRPLDENPVGTLLSDDSDLGIVNLAEGGNQAVKVPHAGGHDTAPTDIEMPGNEGVAGTSDESGERGAHDDDSHGQSEDGGDPGPDNGDTNGEMDCDRYLNHGGGYRALGGTGGGDDDDDGGGLTTTDDRWESHLHSTCLKLRLNLHGSKPYPISIAYDFKFQIIRVTDSPIDREQLTRDLSQPEVIALVDFKIENRPRETQVDRSYACIGFVAHRKESIRRREFLHRGGDLPAKVYKRGQQQQNQRGLVATLGLSSGRPVATAAFSYNKNFGATVEATDTNAMPRYLVDYEPGDEWDGAEKSYASFNIAYESQKAQLDIEPSHSDLQVKTGMGINLRPSGLEQILPKISFINRNQVLIWVLDPTSKSRVRGIVVLMSSYLDNIRAKERLSIYEQEDIDLINTATLKKREATNEEHKPGTISVSIVNVQAPKARRLAIIPAFRARRQPLVTPVDIPPHEILARGWNATNNEWRTVLWPALDQNMQAAEAEGTSAAWKIKWDVTPNTPEAEESQKTDRKGTGIGEGNGKGKGKGKGPV